MRVFLLSLLLLANAHVALAQPRAFARQQAGAQGGEPSAEETREVDELLRRFADARNRNILSGMMWTLTHASADGAAVKEILQYLQTFFRAAEKKDGAALRAMGGVSGFRDKFIAYLGHPDDVVRGSAALMLAVVGDASAAPHIARLLRAENAAKRAEADDWKPTRIAGGRAALALALLGAKEFKPDVMRLLVSDNEYDRAGAANALALMGAREEAGRIAALLKDEDESVRVAAIDALATLGAREHVAEIAGQLSDPIYSEVKRSAVMALVMLNAGEYKKEIAALLKNRFVNREAAMALALLGASEYAEEIAQVLRGEDSLSRLGAMGALGILRAEKYAPEIARRMRDDKSYARSYAAAALVLMESEEYGREAVAVIEGGLNLELFDFDLPPGLEDRAKALRERLKKSFALLKERAKAGRPEAGAKP